MFKSFDQHYYNMKFSQFLHLFHHFFGGSVAAKDVFDIKITIGKKSKD